MRKLNYGPKRENFMRYHLSTSIANMIRRLS